MTHYEHGWELVAGIDPGTRLIGTAIVAVRGQELQAVDIRSWKIVGDSIEKRVAHVTSVLEGWIPEGVKLVGVENGYVGQNPRTALAIAMARGVAISAAQRHGAEARLVDPSEARAAIGAAKWGQKRRAAKDMVQRAIARILNLDRDLTEDEADAAACAVWAANRVWGLEGAHA